MHDRHVKDYFIGFFFPNVLLIYSCASECPGLGAGFGVLCSQMCFSAGPCLCAGAECSSALLLTGRFSLGLLIQGNLLA